MEKGAISSTRWLLAAQGEEGRLIYAQLRKAAGDAVSAQYMAQMLSADLLATQFTALLPAGLVEGVGGEWFVLNVLHVAYLISTVKLFKKNLCSVRTSSSFIQECNCVN